jgi:uncharacterized protein YaaN involved in tellurite resistance
MADENLKLPAVSEIKKDLAIVDPKAIQVTAGEDGDLDTRADQFAETLLNLDPEKPDDTDKGKAGVETMGMDLQRKAAKMSDILKQPLTVLSKKGAEGGDIANSLINLKTEVEKLDPGKFDLEAGWMTRTIGRLPGIGTPMKRYFSKYESAQTVISSIVRSLENGRDQLLRDNQTLTEDQKQMREMTGKLARAIKLGQLIDQKLQYKLDREIEAGSPKAKFVAEELQFPLRQRIIDLQQQLAVNQQGVMAIELIMRNNKELARGVNRALNVTITALQVGATVALALENQRIVLDKVNAVSKTTSDLIAGTANRLKTQGVEIQKQASSTMLNMDSLKAAFADINTAMEDLSKFRTQALPQMANTVLELDKVTADAEKSIKTMESGNRARPDIKIELE